MLSKNKYSNMKGRGRPGGPAAKTLHLQCREPGLIPVREWCRMMQLKSLQAATKDPAWGNKTRRPHTATDTWLSQINKWIQTNMKAKKKKKKTFFPRHTKAKRIHHPCFALLEMLKSFRQKENDNAQKYGSTQSNKEHWK